MTIPNAFDPATPLASSSFGVPHQEAADFPPINPDEDAEPEDAEPESPPPRRPTIEDVMLAAGMKLGDAALGGLSITITDAGIESVAAAAADSERVSARARVETAMAETVAGTVRDVVRGVLAGAMALRREDRKLAETLGSADYLALVKLRQSHESAKAKLGQAVFNNSWAQLRELVNIALAAKAAEAVDVTPESADVAD
jgi:hypothetical protein